MPVAFTIYGIFAYSLIAALFLLIRKRTGGNRIWQGLRYGFACCAVWIVYLWEPLPHVAPLDRITYPVADGLALIVMGLLLGWLLGRQFEQYITSIDHWIAFVLLGIIGGNMIREALSKDEDQLDASLACKTMLLLAVATSIDALAVGITFAFLPCTRIVPAVALIGTITFAFSAAGIRLGSVVGLRFKRKAEFAGGGILILLGTKILLEHLGIL